MAGQKLLCVCCIFVGLYQALRVCRLKTLLCLSAMMFMATVFYRSWEEFHARRAGPVVFNPAKITVEGSCRHPDLDFNNEMIAKYIEDVGEIKCEQRPNWLSTQNGYIYVNQDVVDRLGNVTCVITYLVRQNDFKTVPGKKFMLDSTVGFAKLESDFFTAHCSTKKGTYWRNVMAGVHRNETVVAKKKRRRPPKDSLHLNVLMFGMDSISRMHFMRKLPASYSYLTNVLNATVLQGYNIVGDGTPQALIPILTGMAEPELPETRHRMEGANRVNVYPFIWNEFSDNGYVTAYGEDMSYIGTFTYRMTGFDEQPTDHYMRPFYVKAESVLKNHPNFCLRNTPRHRVMLDWLRQFYDVYSDLPKFAFLFHSELSHDNYNTVGYVDSDLENFLRGLQRDNILNNTLLIVMSDHGHRFANIRETQQGKEEERLPFFSIRVPPWLEKVHPRMVRNLRRNVHRLTTPFDMYSTLMTVLYTDIPDEGDLAERSISLFSEVPTERTCKDADIEPHWCACLSWVEVSQSDDTADNVAQSVIDFINELTTPYRELCAALTLGEVTRLQRLIPNEALLRFKKNADYDGFEADFTDNTRVTEVYYEVQLRAVPSYGLYEATVVHLVDKDEFVVKEKDVSRVNTYNNQDHCIHDSVPRMGKYCFCNDLL